MRVYILDSNTTEQYIKIFKKKVSYENIIFYYQRKIQFESKKKRAESKRIKKHAFRKHIRYLG